MFKTIKNALKTPDVRKRLIYTLILIVLFRLGCYITVPGVNTIVLNEAMTSIFDNNLTYNIRPTGVPIRSLFISSTVFDNSSKLIFETSIDL